VTTRRKCCEIQFLQRKRNRRKTDSKATGVTKKRAKNQRVPSLGAAQKFCGERQPAEGIVGGGHLDTN